MRTKPPCTNYTCNVYQCLHGTFITNSSVPRAWV